MRSWISDNCRMHVWKQRVHPEDGDDIAYTDLDIPWVWYGPGNFVGVSNGHEHWEATHVARHVELFEARIFYKDPAGSAGQEE